MMNPDCRDGKHASCSGDGWDDVMDNAADCPCACHTTVPQRVQRKRTKGWRMPTDAVYVGRGSKWGNPYPIGSMYKTGGDTWVVLNAEWSITLYREHLNARPGGRHSLAAGARAELEGKDLACWCALDQPCHADVHLELANAGGA